MLNHRYKAKRGTAAGEKGKRTRKVSSGRNYRTALRLAAKLDSPELAPLASRIRCRLRTEALSPQQLLAALTHVLKGAGNPKLMSPQLLQTLCEHAAGNLRLLMNMANDLLVAASQQERELIDEKLFFEVFSLDPKPAKKP